MLTRIAEGVWTHESAFLQSQLVVVQGAEGVLLVDPGITRDELADLANDLRELGQPVVAGFSTHPHWDHLLWHPDFGDAPRYATAQGATEIGELLATDNWRDRVAGAMPEDIGPDIPLDLFGQIEPLPAATHQLPWDGPTIRVLEHRAHASGHAALLIEASGVLIAGDMLSDILIPFLGLKADDPVGEYLAGLTLLEGVTDEVEVLVTGHGSVAIGEQVPQRIALDRAYVEALRDGRDPDDPRVRPDSPFGADWLPGIHGWQVAQVSAKKAAAP